MKAPEWHEMRWTNKAMMHRVVTAHEFVGDHFFVGQVTASRLRGDIQKKGKHNGS
jgi:hypothetical protein